MAGSVISGQPLYSRAVSGVFQHVCIILGPVLASRAPSPTAAAAARNRYCSNKHPPTHMEKQHTTVDTAAYIICEDLSRGGRRHNL